MGKLGAIGVKKVQPCVHGADEIQQCAWKIR